MTALFIAILNMSITASYVALAVIVIRLLLKKAPKVFSYILWLAVLVRLIFPFSFHSPFSFLSFLKPNIQTTTGTIEYIPYHIGMMEKPSVEIGFDRINQAIHSALPPATPTTSVNPMQFILNISAMIWVVGIVILFLYFVISYIMLKHNVRTATLVRKNIFETDKITTPFVCGFIKPKIYIPVGMSENELSYILAHEQTHIQRLDYLIKPFAFLVLIVHWFNPLMWICFTLMSKDMEMSCDENVIKKMGDEVKGSYSTSLLSLSVQNSGLSIGNSLPFGESHIRSRIKHVLNYKKPTSRVMLIACIITLLFILGCTANPAVQQNSLIDQIEELATLNSSNDQIEELATVWANALKTREGKPRYDMMSENMKEKFKQEQINRAGENWNFNIGVSSPWVVDFEINIDGKTAIITYFTRTSEPASYQREESVSFEEDKGQFIVTDYQVIYEDILIE